MDLDLERIEAAIVSRRELPGDAARAPMAPEYRRYPAARGDGEWRDAAVLILLYTCGGAVRFPLMLRPSGDGVHAGQVSLPGGRREPGESPEACALRETYEELGVDPGSVRVLRELSPLEVPPSRFVVHPFVGVVAARPAFVPSASEVVAVFEPSLDELLDPRNALADACEYAGSTWRVPYYRLDGRRVWGATAMALAEFAAALL